MRNVLFILLLMLTLVACSSKKKAVDAVGTPATEESAQGEAGAPANGDEPVTIGAMENPVGEVRMVDGRTLKLSKLNAMGAYYMYIVGTLNGRSSTIVALTRRDDFYKWKGINFTDPSHFSILTIGNQQLQFSDAEIYIGKESQDTFTFHTLSLNGFETEPITVNKRDVKLILFAPPKEK